MSASEYEKSRRTIEDHFAIFGSLVALGNAALKRRQYDGAATYAQMAAHYAWLNHAGLFASPRLERLLLDIGVHAIEAPGCPQMDAPAVGIARHVLHVMSLAFPNRGTHAVSLEMAPTRR